MSKAKFLIGDKVLFADRAPKEIRQQVRTNQIRTIVAAYYDPQLQAIIYELGSNRGRGKENDTAVKVYRSYELRPATPGKRGRPRIHQKRKGRKENNGND